MSSTAARLRIVYLFTTFPLLSETPAQREIRALASLPVELEIHSLWRGGRAFEGVPVHRFALWRLPLIACFLPYWLVRRPRVFRELARRLAASRMPSLLNGGETMLGLAFALCHAKRIARAERRPDLIHAGWATGPASAAQLLSALTGIPFSMGAHAYDVTFGQVEYDAVSIHGDPAALDRVWMEVQTSDPDQRLVRYNRFVDWYCRLY